MPIELFQIRNELSLTIAKYLFTEATNNYKLRHLSDLTYTIRKPFFNQRKAFLLNIKIKSTLPAKFEKLSSPSLFTKAINNVNLKIVLSEYGRHES